MASATGAVGRCLVAPLALLLAGTLAACDEDPPEPWQVLPVDAYTAIVSWQAAEQEPVVNDAGEVQLPVIYVVAADGDMIDIGVQAAVTEATTTEAVVRFADEASDSFDASTEGTPVHDAGVMLSIGAIPEPAHAFDVEVDRFTAKDDHELMDLRVTATNRATNDSDPERVVRAEVTRVRPR